LKESANIDRAVDAIKKFIPSRFFYCFNK